MRRIEGELLLARQSSKACISRQGKAPAFGGTSIMVETQVSLVVMTAIEKRNTRV